MADLYSVIFVEVRPIGESSAVHCRRTKPITGHLEEPRHGGMSLRFSHESGSSDHFKNFNLCHCEIEVTSQDLISGNFVCR
jgi:hypothetical protein